MRVGAVAALCIIVLAGCIDADGRAEQDRGAEADAAVESHAFGARGCEASVLVFMVPFEQTLEWLPPGYNPRDVEGFLGLPVAAGSAGVLLTAVTCASSQFDPDGIEMAFAAVFVEPPGVAQDLEPATYEFYEVMHFLPEGGLLDTLARWQWANHAASVQVDRVAAPASQSIFAAVEDTQGVLFQFVTGTPVEVPFEDALLRLWHQSPSGTGFFEYRIDQNIQAGPALCTVRPGSLPAEMAGDFSCPPARSVAVTFPGFDFEGTLEFWPGVFP